MLKEVVEYLVSLGRFGSEPGFVDIPGRPDLVIERIGGGFGRIWESAIWQASEVSDLAGLADWVSAVKTHSRGVPQRAVVHASAKGVEAFVEWVQLSSVRESWFVTMPVPVSDAWRFVRRIREKQSAGELWAPAELGEGLSRTIVAGVTSSELVESLRGIQWTRTAVTVSSGGGSSERSENKVASAVDLPWRLFPSIKPSPVLGGFEVSVGIKVEARPEVAGFELSFIDGDLFDLESAFVAELRTRVQAIFDGLEVMPEGAELPVPAVVVRGAMQHRTTAESPSASWERMRNDIAARPNPMRR